MAETDKLQAALSKARSDTEFWRTKYAELETKHKALTGESEQRTATQAQSNAKLEAVLSDLRDATDDKEAAFGLLRKLRAHVAGRNGMLELSNQFCAVCQNPNGCPMGEVKELIGQ